MTRSCEVRRLGIDDVGLIARIDRSEHVEVEYTVVDDRLIERPVSDRHPAVGSRGDGAVSVAAEVAFCEPLVAGGAVPLGAFDGDCLLGLRWSMAPTSRHWPGWRSST